MNDSFDVTDDRDGVDHGGRGPVAAVPILAGGFIVPEDLGNAGNGVRKNRSRFDQVLDGLAGSVRVAAAFKGSVIK